jgi:putative Holliday junction resolvase
MAAALIGIDYGARRIGIAAADGRLAVPVAVIEHTTRDGDLDRIAAIARERRVEAIVIGLPLLMSGDEGEQARRTRRFGEALARRTGLPVRYHDERLSSFRAEDDVASADGATRRRRPADDIAAAHILQAYIDATATSAATTPGTAA